MDQELYDMLIKQAKLNKKGGNNYLASMLEDAAKEIDRLDTELECALDEAAGLNQMLEIS